MKSAARSSERSEEIRLQLLQSDWDVKNLFLCDAPFASNADKNPTLTIMALSWRVRSPDRSGEERKPVNDTNGAGEMKTGTSAHGYKNGKSSVLAEGGSPGPRLTRRDAMQWVLAAVAVSVAPPDLFAQPAHNFGRHMANLQPDPSLNGKGSGLILTC